MTRRLSPTDRLLSRISHMLAQTSERRNDDSEAKPHEVTPNVAMALRGHHAMDSAARAFALGRGLGSSAPSKSGIRLPETSADRAAHANETTESLHVALKHSGTTPSFLLPALWTGGVILGAASRTLNSYGGSALNAHVEQQAARADQKTRELVHVTNTQVGQTGHTASTSDIAAQQSAHDDATEAGKLSAERRRHYSLRTRRSPSEQLVAGAISRGTNLLFRLTRRL